MLNEHGLEVFLQVYRAGSIRLAAQQLYISPQSVSKTILGLEAELKEPLFVRERRLLLPTARAVQLEEQAERILQVYRQIRQNRPGAAARVQLKVYCTYGVMEYLGAGFVGQFGLLRPDILLYLIEVPDKQALELLRRRGRGLAILSDPSDHNLFEAQLLFTASYCHVVQESSPLCKLDEISVRDLAGMPIVGKGNEFQLYINQMARFSNGDPEPRVVLETTSYHLAMQMAKEGLASALVPGYLARQCAPPGTAVKPAVRGELEKRFYLVRPKNGQLEGVSRAFSQFLRDWVRQNPVDGAAECHP